MSKLQTCNTCSRHIRVDESSCPFCGEAAAAAFTGGAVRSAIFAGVLAGASVAGCGDATPAVEEPSRIIDPGPANVSDAMAAVPVEGDAAFAEDPTLAEDPDVAVDPDEAPPEVVPPLPPRDFPKMPYGAPPLRSRLV